MIGATGLIKAALDRNVTGGPETAGKPSITSSFPRPCSRPWAPVPEPSRLHSSPFWRTKSCRVLFQRQRPASFLWSCRSPSIGPEIRTAVNHATLTKARVEPFRSTIHRLIRIVRDGLRLIEPRERVEDLPPLSTLVPADPSAQLRGRRGAPPARALSRSPRRIGPPDWSGSFSAPCGRSSDPCRALMLPCCPAGQERAQALRSRSVLLVHALQRRRRIRISRVEILDEPSRKPRRQAYL